MDYWRLLRTTFQEWQGDNAIRLAASLAYYTIFSLAPLLIIVIGVAGLVLGREAAQGQLFAQLSDVVGADGARVIEDMVDQSNIQSASLFATLLGVLTLLLGATGVFGELQASLNQIWDVHPKAAANVSDGLRQLLRGRLVSLAMIFGIGLLLFVTVIISTALVALATGVFGDAENARVGQAINFVLSLGVTTVLFAAIFKVLPDVRIAWRDVWVGAAFTAVLFSIGRLLIGLYLGISSGASVFGAAASLIVLLIWINYSAQIFFFGAEFTQVYARTRGTRRAEQHLLGEEPADAQPSQQRPMPSGDTTQPPTPPVPLFGWIATLAIFGAVLATSLFRRRRD